MPFSSYGMFCIGVAMGGVVFLGIFSMLAMARKQDEDQDRLEMTLNRGNQLASPGNHEVSPDDTRVFVNLDLKQGGSTKSCN